MHERAHEPVIDALERALSLLVPMVLEAPDPNRKRRPGPGRWSAHEHACHLAAVEPMFSARLDLMLRQDRPNAPGR